MKKNFEMRFNPEIAYTPGKMPTLILEIVDPETDKVITEGYLTPFRGYRFQVSGTMDGQGDFGSTQVIHFKEFETLSDIAIAEILRSLAMAAIHAFSKSGYVRRGLRNKDEDFEWTVEVPRMTFGWTDTESVWYKYIKEVYSFLYPDHKWPYID